MTYADEGRIIPCKARMTVSLLSEDDKELTIPITYEFPFDKAQTVSSLGTALQRMSYSALLILLKNIDNKI